MNNTSVLDKTVEGRGEPFFWHTRPTSEQVQLMVEAKQEPVINMYWQEPILQRERYKGSIVEPLPTYRIYTNTQF